MALPETVTITTSGRLHLGFMDPSGQLSRSFGSLGISLDRPQTSLTLKRHECFEVLGGDQQRAERLLAKLCAHFDSGMSFKLELSSTLNRHAGLGSGTQIALAIGHAFSSLQGLRLTTEDIALFFGRGQRSGIGIGAFDGGGVLFDGGRNKAHAVPPILSRIPFPEEWPILLIFDPNIEALHGLAEKQAFANLPPFPEETCADLCRRMVMAALPALIEKDFDIFCKEIKYLQCQMGNYFGPTQGGQITSHRVAAVLDWLESEGFEGIGQSSWGPTGFALLPSNDEAKQILQEVKKRWPEEHSGLRFEKACGKNSGALKKNLNLSLK